LVAIDTTVLISVAKIYLLVTHARAMSQSYEN